MMASFKIMGQRECEHCKQKVNIIERDGQEISECLSCEEIKLQKEMIEFKERADKRKSEIIFNKYSLIPGDLIKATFDNFNPENAIISEAKRKCVEYVSSFDSRSNKSLLLQGSYGLGKSHLAYSIAKEIKDKGNVVIFITMPELLNVLRDSYNNRDFSEIDILNACRDADLLILDDLGAEYVKLDNYESWATDKIFQIVNSRMDKPNVFTTNLNSREMEGKYGLHSGRIVSRIMAGTRVIKLEGKDYRLRGW